ncbi:UNVERIFIED_CONTAM: (-)-isopiperitenone reductase [Sesamum radiatum]|uniref:(-)-isopiperitenone reductase n=1 Tax=Sesamum radiatum TaxID=300843 RepID=A0AAW2VMC9_SESRA
MGVEESTVEQPSQDTTSDSIEALLEAARYDDIDDVKSIASTGVSLDSEDSQGRTALHMASANGHVHIVDYLINNGANVNACNMEKNTPLHWACLNGQIEVVKRLILAGANISLLNSHERTPMDEAISRGKMDVIDAINEAAAQVNNAGISGIGLDGDVLILQQTIERDGGSLLLGGKPEPVQPKASGTIFETLEDAEQCVETNYYGAKRVTEALIPLLKLSDAPRVVNVSSTLGNLRLLCNEWAKGVLSNQESLTEEKVDEVVQEFLKNFKEGSLQANDWPSQLAAYKVSKAALNAYTRIISRKYPSFCINSVCPGFARTDITCNLGPLSASEAAESPLKLALLPDGGPSGCFFYRNQISSF